MSFQVNAQVLHILSSRGEPKTRFDGRLSVLCFVIVIWISAAVSSPASDRPTTNISQIPGEPLNPDDFAAAKQYVEDLKTGKIKEPKNKEQTGDVRERGRARSGNTPTPWNSCQIPYEISGQFNKNERTKLMRAANDFRFPGSVTWVPRTPPYSESYLLFEKATYDEGCTSSVGMMGGEQITYIADWCINEGSVQHEMMHVLGFDHEHERPDRDDHVTIVSENIEDDLVAQFSPVSESNNQLTDYDIGSILHYSSYADCKNPCKQTIINKHPKRGVYMGQRKGLSQLDKLKVKKLYPRCTGNSPSNNNPNNYSVRSGGCEDLDERCAAVQQLDCGKNHTWINFNCRKTCNQCDQGNCIDFNPKCDIWASENYCIEYPEYMFAYCPKSCRKCATEQ